MILYLILIIFIKQVDAEDDDLKPVMVYIHGGGFVHGSGNGETDFIGPGYFMDRELVLVTFNYRLGVLGNTTLRYCIFVFTFEEKKNVQSSLTYSLEK